MSLKKSKSSSSKLPKLAKGENVSVCVRMRPLNRLEKRTNQKEAWTADGENAVIQQLQELGSSAKQGRGLMSCLFDYVFTPRDNNEYLFEQVGRPVVDSCMRGYHACIFAYGQTSAGKTYTIHGSNKNPGVIPLAVDHLFVHIENTPNREFVLRVSYLEIYNEIVNDLLAPENTNLRIREDRRLGVFVQGLKEDVVMSPDQVFSLLHAGTSHRHVGRTNYNDVSSRSHTIFRLVVESSPRGNAKGGVRTSTLNIVDLAGSENAVKAGSADRLKETGYINKSLLTLGHVIFKLSENVNDAHIPYRDSKLTRILQSSLSGRARVSVVCNISPSSGNIEETVSTLKFAMRAKKIVGSAKVNEKMDGATLLKKYREEIENLKNELIQTRSDALLLAEKTAQKKEQESKKKLMQAEQDKMKLMSKIEQLQRLILVSSSDEKKATEDAASVESGDASEGAPVPQIMKKKSSRRPPLFKSGSQRSRLGSIGSMTVPSGVLEKALREAREGKPVMARRPSLENLKRAAPDLDEPTGNEEDDELLCDAEPSTADLATDAEIDSLSPEELKKRLKAAMKALRSRDQQVTALSLEKAEMQQEIDEKTELLQEWDAYYIQNSNKIAAFQNEVRRAAADATKESQKEMSQLFSALGMDEEEWDSPLVDIVPESAIDTSTVGRKSTQQFRGIMDRWKGMEQDLD